MADDAVGGVEALDGLSGPKADQVELSAMTADASKEAIATGNLSDAMEGAMAGITKMPGGRVDAVAFKDTLAGDASSDVIREKTGILTDGKGDASQNPQDALMSRYEKLYVDMTVFQVAWSIARRVQQDTSQLLRGQ